MGVTADKVVTVDGMDTNGWDGGTLDMVVKEHEAGKEVAKLALDMFAAGVVELLFIVTRELEVFN